MPTKAYLLVGPATHVRTFLRELSKAPTLDFHVWKREARA